MPWNGSGLVPWHRSAFRFVWRRCLFGHSRQVEEALRNRLFAHLQTLSYSYFDKANTGNLMAHATNDVQAVQLATGMGLVALTDTVVLGTAAIGFMLYINPTLTLIAILPMPFIALFARSISKIFYERFQKVQASFSHTSPSEPGKILPALGLLKPIPRKPLKPSALIKPEGSILPKTSGW